MPFKAIVFLFSVLCAALCTCSDNNDNPTYPFERSVLDVSIAKRCMDASSSNSKCYLIRWQHPIEKKDLQSYYIWLDTLVVNDSVKNASQTHIERAAASVAYSGRGDGDSLDLTGLIDEYLERDSLHVAIWAKYAGDEHGAVFHFYAYFGDDIPPSTVNFRDSVSAGTIWLEWTRPTDQRDFYSPEAMDGPIVGYNVRISAVTVSESIRNATTRVSLAGNSVSDYVRSYEWRKIKRDSVAMVQETATGNNFLTFAITDGKGFVSDNALENSWKLEISGLNPEHSYDISVVAFDSAGNSSGTNRRVKTTDDIPPLIAKKFWLYPDTNDGLARLDSNRLILFWLRSVDPLYLPTPITLDNDNLNIPASCISGECYREVETYLLEQWNGSAWDTVSRISPVGSGYYSTRYRLENDTMIANATGDFSGNYVSDTLRWILPGEEIRLRVRAIDYSGHYSAPLETTIAVSKGELGQYDCPQNFVPVRKDQSSVFCMEKLQHTVGNAFREFERNILYREAKRTCENLSYSAGFENFAVSLCTEQEWNAACNSGGSTYGVIEERGFLPNNFLFDKCGVVTGDSLSAYTINKRNKSCASPDGVRDLPGQLQEWVTGTGDAAGESIPLLKGISYANFEGASRVELAQCRNRFMPTRIRPRYTTDTVWLYRSGSRIDTLEAIDTLRTLYSFLEPSSFTQAILIYDLKNSEGDYIGTDYVDKAEFNRRGGEEWLKVLWHGLEYEFKEEKKVLILGTESIDASNFFLDPTVGFRCCATTSY